MTAAEQLVDLFDAAATAVADVLAPLSRADLLRAGGRPGQYALDLVADEAALRVLEKAPVRIVSEESGLGGDESAAVSVVLDPVDGSTNMSRGIPYWATSIAAVDGDGLLAALVANQATGDRFVATRGGGAHLDGVELSTSGETAARRAVVATTGVPSPRPAWGLFRNLGSAALEICGVAAGQLDGYVDTIGGLRPWDYLGALLICDEAGGAAVDLKGRDLVTTSTSDRRQVVAAATPELLDALVADIT